MKVIRIFHFNLRINSKIFFSTVVSIILFTQCAQIVPLTGGKKDVQPPQVVSIYPINYTKNFSAPSIVYTFNEKIQLINPNDNIIITPAVSKPLEWKVKGKILELYLPSKDLLSNTTYKLVFNKAIADLSERNVCDNIEYVFSTGEHIDSFYIKGKIKHAWTHQEEPLVLVALYDAIKNDSVVLKEKPLYFTRTDNQGNYLLKHLPGKEFKMVVFSDVNNNFYYDVIKEKIGFVEYPVNPSKDSILDFWIAEEKGIKNYLKKISTPNAYQIYLVYSYPDRYELLYTSSNVRLLNDSTYSDTCKILVHGTDTIHLAIKNSTQIDTLHIPINKKTKIKPTYQLKNQINNRQPFFLPAIVASNFWIDTTEVKNSIILYHDKDSSLHIDKRYIEVYPHKLKIVYPFQQNSLYTLKIPVKSIDSRDSVVYQKIDLKTDELENYAHLKVNIVFPQKGNYLVALCNSQHKIIYSKSVYIPVSSSNEQTIEFRNIIPDTYSLKIIQDDNHNYLWDTHCFFSGTKKQKAEKIFIYSKSIKLINNWDVVIDWKDVK